MDCDERKIQRVEFCSFYYVAIYCPFADRKSLQATVNWPIVASALSPHANIPCS